jgi:hypothetical protein
VYIIILISVNAQTNSSLPPPSAEFIAENINDTGKWYLKFPTVRGYAYQVEESTDLENWTPSANGHYYGNGNTQKCFICDGPIPPAASTSSNASGSGPNWVWALRTINLKLYQTTNGQGPGIIRLSRPSYTPSGASEPLAAWDAVLAESFPPQPEGVRFFAILSYDDFDNRIMYWVDVTVHSETAPDLTDSLATSPEEGAEIAVFQQVKAQLIGRMLQPNGSSQNTEPLSRKYARLRQTEVDTNGNGFMDWWEEQFNYDPFALVGEVGYADPNGDSDNDGFLNSEDTDPKDKEKHPPPVTYVVAATKFFATVSYTEGTIYNNWEAPQTAVTFSEHASPGDLVTLLNQAVFPSNSALHGLRHQTFETGVDLHTASTYYHRDRTSSTDPFVTSSVRFSRYWLVHKPKETYPVSANYLLHKKITIDGVLQPENHEVITLTVAENETQSDELNIKADFDGSSGGAEFEINHTVSLLPITVMQPTVDADGTVGALAPVDSVRFCRWNSPRTVGVGRLTNPGDFPKDDPDRIIISIPLPQKTGTGPLKIHVSTTGAENTPTGTDGDYNDSGAEIELIEQLNSPGIFESKPIALVADQDDDQWSGGRVAADGALNDPTLIGWPGGKLKIKVPDLNNTIIELPIKKFTHFFSFVLVNAGEIESNTHSWLAVTKNLTRMEEIYAPLLERVDQVQQVSISQSELQTIIGEDNKLSNWEVKALIAKIDTLGLPADAIKIVFVRKPFTRDASVQQPTGVLGENLITLEGRGDIVLCFTMALTSNLYNSNPSTHFSTTAAHECGHSLRGAGHNETGGIFNPALVDQSALLPNWCLMAKGDTNNFIREVEDTPFSGKHWYIRDQK